MAGYRGVRDLAAGKRIGRGLTPSPLGLTARQFGKWDGRGESFLPSGDVCCAWRDLAVGANPPPCYAGPLRGGDGERCFPSSEGWPQAGSGPVPRPRTAAALCLACAKVSCPELPLGEGRGEGPVRSECRRTSGRCRPGSCPPTRSAGTTARYGSSGSAGQSPRRGGSPSR